MKRISLIILTTLTIALLVSARSRTPQSGAIKPALQTFPGATKLNLRRISVNAKTITALTRGKSYIVDLTQRGVVYEFSHQTGQIDLSRVKVRTAKGEVAVGSFLETTFLKGKLAGIKYKSQDFSLASTQTGTLQKSPSPRSTQGFQCDFDICTCTGSGDCLDMVFTGLCRSGTIFCTRNPITGAEHCGCGRS